VLWNSADRQGRLIVALLFTGIAPGELGMIRGRDLDREHGFVDVPGASARRVTLVEPLRSELTSLLADPANDPAQPIIADGTGQSLSEAAIDTQLACCAHDAGLRQPESVTAGALHFTYAAYLARQGIRMAALHTIVGRLSGEWTNELLRLSPPAGLVDTSAVERTYPAFKSA
jgi:integrase